MPIAKFQRNFQGVSVFKCRVCKRGSRDTGDNGSVELCPQCYEVAGIENYISDNSCEGEELAKNEAVIKRLNQAAVFLGGKIAGYSARVVASEPVKAPAFTAPPDVDSGELARKAGIARRMTDINRLLAEIAALV